MTLRAGWLGKEGRAVVYRIIGAREAGVPEVKGFSSLDPLLREGSQEPAQGPLELVTTQELPVGAFLHLSYSPPDSMPAPSITAQAFHSAPGKEPGRYRSILRVLGKRA